MTFAVLEELFAYIGFGADDAARLRALHPVLAPHFPAIAGQFYEALWRHPGAAEVLRGPEQIERLRVTLIDWMSSGLRGPYDAAFYDKRSRIGRRHVQIGLRQHYMFAAMNVVRSAYHERIVALHDPAAAFAILRSVDKLLDVELAVMLRHYQLDSEAQRLAALQTLTAGLAHEVRNPLNAAKLQLQLLERRAQRDGDGDPRVLEPSALARQELKRLSALLGEFVAFAEPPELHVQEHDAVALVAGAIAGERAAAAARGVAIELAPDPARLPAQVDGAKLDQIVRHLVRNAVEAAPAGGRVAVELAAALDGLRLRVTDDGPGIPPELRSRIYEPFFSTKSGGTGLGMSIVHSLVAAHGGSIDLDTGPHGTRFEIAIPSSR